MKVDRRNKERRIAIPPKYRNIVGLIDRISKLPSPVVNEKLLNEISKLKTQRMEM
jgi:hypothetical protein